MNTSFKTLLADKIIFISSIASTFFFLGAIGIAAAAYTHLPPFLPLYNKLAWGYARLGHTYEIAIPIGIPLLLCIFNVFLAKYIFGKTPLLARFLFLITLLVALFTFIFILKLTLIIL